MVMRDPGFHHPVGEGQGTQRNAFDAPSSGTGVASPVGLDLGVCCSAGRGFHHVGVARGPWL